MKLNGKYLTGNVTAYGSCTVISTIFVNCSNRCIICSESLDRLYVDQCSFINCSCKRTTDYYGKGGCILSSCRQSIIKSSRAFHISCEGEGIMVYCSNKCTYPRISYISINAIDKTIDEHYVFMCFSNSNVNNINITKGEVFYDVGIVTERAKYITYHGITCRTLFRYAGPFLYGNIIDCNARGLSFNGGDEISYFYFSGNNFNKIILYEESRKVIFNNCIFIGLSIEASELIEINYAKTSGSSYFCLDDIPLVCPSNNPKTHNIFSLVLHISFSLFMVY
jgi:hypothetical protein